jgi:hypothetical protein
MRDLVKTKRLYRMIRHATALGCVPIAPPEGGAQTVGKTAAAGAKAGEGQRWQRQRPHFFLCVITCFITFITIPDGQIIEIPTFLEPPRGKPGGGLS